jgi:prepilin-type N-terminal cleavage/methylation domain-containing protein
MDDRRYRIAGFTLIEMLIAIFVFGLITIVATRFMVRQTSAVNRTTEVANAQQNVRAALSRLSSDMRVVGQGLNFYDIQVPDMIVPNDGSSPVGTFRDDQISLISIPDPTVASARFQLNGGFPNNGDVGSTSVRAAGSSDLSGLGPGERIILFDGNTGNSQVVTLTGISGKDLSFASDPLIYPFPPVSTTVLKLNEVRYRVSTSSGIPFLERKVNQGAWVRFIEGISRIQFIYYDDMGNTLSPTTQAQRRSIRRVDVEVEGIQLRLTTGGDRRAHITLSSSVVPRNMLTP